jgi:type IV/VI secretion system ImpK/VasF family protein
MDSATELFRLASREFLFLTSFRQKVRKGVRVPLEETARDLEEIFAEQARLAREDPRMEALYERGRYPLVVLADEILLHSGWEFAPDWEARILEERYFRTNIGGDQYFAMARELRPEDVEIASILYAGVTLGFKGKYRERPEKLAEARKYLYRLLSEFVATAGEKLTPDAYHVVAQPLKKLSPAVTLARVAIVGLAVVVIYWIVTFVFWESSVSRLREVVTGMGL